MGLLASPPESDDEDSTTIPAPTPFAKPAPTTDPEPTGDGRAPTGRDPTNSAYFVIFCISLAFANPPHKSTISWGLSVDAVLANAPLANHHTEDEEDDVNEGRHEDKPKPDVGEAALGEDGQHNLEEILDGGLVHNAAGTTCPAVTTAGLTRPPDGRTCPRA